MYFRSDFDKSIGNALLHVPDPNVNPLYTGYFDQDVWAYYTQQLNYVYNSLNANCMKAESLRLTLKQDKRGSSSVAEFCKLIESSENPNHMSGISNSEDTIPAYVQHLLLLQYLERYRCTTDMNRYDLYSVKWDKIEISPPSVPRKGCGVCRVGLQGVGQMCAYHTALSSAEALGLHIKTNNPVPIEMAQQLKSLPAVLLSMQPSKSVMFLSL